jgi:hypothetical protein
LQVLIGIAEIDAVLRSQRPIRPARETVLVMLGEATGFFSGQPSPVYYRLVFFLDVRGFFDACSHYCKNIP